MTNRPQLKTHLDAVVHFIAKMDGEMVSTLLDDAHTYQDFSKALFIRKLGDLFFEFSELGDFNLLTDRGECYGCSCGSKGYTFTGNRSKAFIDLIFITDDENHVIDIYECDEFYNKTSKHKRKRRLFLDRHVSHDLDEDDFFKDDPFRDDELPPF